MATLIELQSQWAEDCKLDELDLGSESTRTHRVTLKVCNPSFKFQTPTPQSSRRFETT